MLPNVLQVVHEKSWAQRWLSKHLPEKPVWVYLDETDRIEFRFNQLDPIVWDAGKILKLIRNSEPKLGVPFAWHLCRLYDVKDETSAALREKLKELTGVTLPKVPFYLSGKNLLTSTDLFDKHSPAEGVHVKPDDGCSLIGIAPTPWLLDLLVDRLEQVA